MRKCYLEIYVFWTCMCTVLNLKKCGFESNDIGSRLQGNRRWQPVVSMEELYFLSTLAVIFSQDIELLYNHRKDVWYFHQKNCRRSKMMYKVRRQRFFHSDKEYYSVSYNETILNTCLGRLFTVIYQWPSNLIPSNKTFSQNTLKFMKKINENLSALNNHF